MPGIAPQCATPLAPERRHALPAAFLDRDGTIIRDAHYLSSADQLRLISGVAEAIRRLNHAGIPVVVVTNQSGIARGYFTAAEYCLVERALDRMLRAAGAEVAATYHCPHLPEISGPCGCRKPGTALFQLAARELNLALDASLYVGDRWRDASPALVLGGVGVLVPAPDTPLEDRMQAASQAVVLDTMGEAVDLFLAGVR